MTTFVNATQFEKLSACCFFCNPKRNIIIFLVPGSRRCSSLQQQQKKRSFSDTCAVCFQSLVDAPSTELAFTLGYQEKKAEDLQETLQRVLDRREEERQSKELLQLYLKAADRGGGQGEPSQAGPEGAGELYHSLNFIEFKKNKTNNIYTHCLL